MHEWRRESIGNCLNSYSFTAFPKIQARDYNSSGTYPIVDQGQAFIAGWTNEIAGVISDQLPVVVFGDHSRTFKYVDVPFVRGADGTQVMRPKYGIDVRYFYFACRAIDLPSQGYSRHFKSLKETEIPLPPLSEQCDIAQVLSTIEDLSALNDGQLSTLVRGKRTAMRVLFTRGLRGEALKDTQIGPVPASWEVTHIEEWVSAISKGSSPKWQGFNYVDEGILFVRSQNVGNGAMEFAEKAFLSVKWNDKETRSILQTGDLLINLVGASIGRCAVGGEEINNANCNQAVCFVRLDQTKLLSKFLCGFLLTDEGQSQIHDSKKDIARANLSLQDVRRLRVPKPALEEQSEIVAILDAIDQKIDLHRRKRAVLDNLFKSLLHKLMTGEIRVADLDLSALRETVALTHSA